MRMRMRYLVCVCVRQVEGYLHRRGIPMLTIQKTAVRCVSCYSVKIDPF